MTAGVITWSGHIQSPDWLSILLVAPLCLIYDLDRIKYAIYGSEFHHWDQVSLNNPTLKNVYSPEIPVRSLDFTYFTSLVLELILLYISSP